MAKKRDTVRKEPKPQNEKALSRRDFVKSGATAGIGVAVLSGTGEARAQGIEWNYEADVVVLGSGCMGLHAAIRARDLGAYVIVVEANYDVGGKMVHSGGFVSLGGGDAIQARDRAGADPDGLGLTAPLVPPADLEDDPDLLFKDITDWSVIDAGGVARYRYNDRQQHRAWADNAPLTRQFQLENYVRFARIDGTHFGGGMSRARMAKAMLKLAAKTDIKAGTLSAADRGDPEKERHSPFNPMRITPGLPGAPVGAPGWVYGGFCLSRCWSSAPGKRALGSFSTAIWMRLSANSSSLAGLSESRPATHQGSTPTRACVWKASGRTATPRNALPRSTSARKRQSLFAQCLIRGCTGMCLRTRRARWLDLTAKMQAVSSPA